jgi:putative adhesin
MSPERRYGIAISVALILGGVYWALTSLSEDTKTSHQTYPVVGTTLSIETSSTEIQVHAGDVKEITVDRKFKRNALGSDPKDKYDDGKLDVGAGGCGFLSFGCDTDYVVTVPKDLDVTVKSSSGDLTVIGLGGSTTLESSSGRIEAQGLSGDLTLASSSGDLEAAGLTSASVSSKSSSGSVELSFTTAPTTVDVVTSSGDASVRLPEGDETYKVDTDSKSGDENAEVKIDPAATRTIKVKSSSGDAVVEYDR